MRCAAFVMASRWLLCSRFSVRWSRRNSAVSPIYADLTGLPPAMFVVGALDPLLDDSLFMWSRWQAAGNDATIEVWPEGAHTFMNMGTPLAAAALARTVDWISNLLASGGGIAKSGNPLAHEIPIPRG